MTHAIPILSADDPVGRLAALFDAHYDRLYRLARRLVPAADDALDLVQETFLRAARAPNAVPCGAGKEEAWLVRVLVNIRRDQWRHAAVHNRFVRGIQEAGSRSVPPKCTPETAAVARTTVWKALDQLPPRCRAIVVLHELDGLEISSIAALLGISAITVRWHLSRGRRELSHFIQPEAMQRTGGME